MAQYFTDFSGYSTGSQPSDWTIRWNTSITWEVQADAGATGGQILKQTAGSAGNHTALSWDEIDSDANRDDVEVVLKYRADSGGSLDFRTGPFGRGAGATANDADCYQIRDFGQFDFNSLRKLVSGTDTSLGSTSKARNQTDWFWARLRINGTSVQAKFWKDGDSEPGTWDVDVTDSDVTGTGWVGIALPAAGDLAEFDIIGVGTNGDAAPTSDPGGGGTTGTGAATLSALTGSGAGQVEITGSGTAALAALAGSASGHLTYSGQAAADLTTVTGSGSGTVGDVISGTAAATLGLFTGSADGHLAYEGTGAATLPQVQADSDGVLIYTATGVASLSKLTGSATGSFTAAGISGQAAAVLSAMTASADGHLAYEGQVSGMLAALLGQAAGITEITGTAAATLAAMTGVAAGTVPIDHYISDAKVVLSAHIGTVALDSGPADKHLGSSNAQRRPIAG